MKKWIIGGIAVLALAGCSSEKEAAPADAPESTTVRAAASTTAAAATTRPELSSSGTDTVFLQVLDSYDIEYGEGPAAINLADSICGGLQRGLSQSDILPSLVDEGPRYTLAEATNFLNTSIVAYCPEEG